MQQPAEVLPQLLLGSALSGQPEAQRGLWLIPKGTSGNSAEAARSFVFVSRGQDVVYFENAAKHRVECHHREEWLPFVIAETFLVSTGGFFAAFLSSAACVLSGARGRSSAEDCSWGTCWWRRCRGSLATLCCWGTLLRDVSRKRRAEACRS